MIRQTNPVIVAHLLLLFTINSKRIIKKIISCGFINNETSLRGGTYSTNDAAISPIIRLVSDDVTKLASVITVKSQMRHVIFNTFSALQINHKLCQKSCKEHLQTSG